MFEVLLKNGPYVFEIANQMYWNTNVEISNSTNPKIAEKYKMFQQEILFIIEQINPEIKTMIQKQIDF